MTRVLVCVTASKHGPGMPAQSRRCSALQRHEESTRYAESHPQSEYKKQGDLIIPRNELPTLSYNRNWLPLTSLPMFSIAISQFSLVLSNSFHLKNSQQPKDSHSDAHTLGDIVLASGRAGLSCCSGGGGGGARFARFAGCTGRGGR